MKALSLKLGWHTDSVCLVGRLLCFS